MPRRIQAHRIRIYPDKPQQELLLKTFGCCRLLYNLALEQRSTYHRQGRRINFVSCSAELVSLKAEVDFFKEVPHHCLVQALRDLEDAYSRFFKGQNGYPKPRKKYDNDSCRFPDAKQFKLAKDCLTLPKLGNIRACVHRPVQGALKSVTVKREGSHWYALILVSVRKPAVKVRSIVEGGYDVGVAQPVVESDGTVHVLPRITERQAERKRRLQRAISRKVKGSKNRDKAKAAFRAFEARNARRRRSAAHRVSHLLASKYTHLAAEDLDLVNMTASARGTMDKPGHNVSQKAGLNRAILDIAPGQLRGMVAYKMAWRGGVFTCVNPAYTSQLCSECGKHPRDDAATEHLPHGRVTRDRFLCPLCGYAADADVNAARNIRARGRQQWTALADHNDAGASFVRTAGPAVSACGASLRGVEAGINFSPIMPSGLPKAA